jgi:hypothetical protein
MGTAAELATEVLKETDWSVSEDSEVITQKVTENLVYLKTLEEVRRVHHIKDQKDDYKNGIDGSGIITIPKNATILAFYSSCQNKPYRF